MASIQYLKTIIIIFIVISIGFLSGCTTTNQMENNKINEGENFTFSLLDGSNNELVDYQGKIVILDMWAIWCGPCKYQMLELKKAYDTYKNNGLEILSINIDPRESNTDIEQFLNTFELYDILTSQIVYGDEFKWIFAQEIDDISKYMPSNGIPTLVIFDQQGKVIFQHTGLLFFSEFPEGWTGERILLKEKIDELIN
jgi:thiol-disulfide isomerase/thioredoxin